MKFTTLILCISLFNASVFAQIKVFEGNLTSETKSTVFNNQVFICYKEYHEPEKSGSKGKRQAGMMTYMDLPLGAKNASVSGDLFETKLACLENENVKWTQSLGRTNHSRPPALAQASDGTLFTGEKQKGQSSIVLYSYDVRGNEQWRQTFDSLQHIHEIFVDDAKYISVLVSFITTEKIKHGSSFSYKSKHAYFTLRVDKSNGKLISKTYNQGPTYFCGIGFSAPSLNSHRAHYYFKNDSLVYSRADTLKMVTLSAEELNQHTVVKVWGNEDEYYGVAQHNKTGKYKLLLYRWATETPLKRELELDIHSKAEVLDILKAESGGVSVVYSSPSGISVKSFNASLEPTETMELMNRKPDFVYSETVLGPDGSFYLLLAHQNQMARSIHLIMP